MRRQRQQGGGDIGSQCPGERQRIVVTVAADEGNEVLQPARPARAAFRPVLRTAPTGRHAAAIPSLQANRTPPTRASPSPAAAAPDQDISRQS
jgi:hypothetical protein